MEDIRQYIESGILELYVLNDLTPEEKLEVERMAVTYPVIQKEIDEISETMELLADEHAIEPREELRAIVLNQLLSNNTIQAPITSKSIEETDEKVISINAIHHTQFYKYAFAASVALLLVSLISLFNIYNHLQESRQQLVALQAQNQKFANQVNFQESQLNQYKQQSGETPLQNPILIDSVTVKGKQNSTELMALENALKQSKSRILALELENKNRDKEASVFYDPDSRFIKLKGTDKSAGNALLIAWNPDKKKLFINKKESALPVNDKDHQYQLWAIRKLKPISLGVFDINKKDSMIQSMLSIDKAAAFAVTLEPRGGSEKPTLTKMMAMTISHK